MDTVSFWKLIDQSRRASNGNPEQQVEEMAALLDNLSTEDVIQFQRIFDMYFHSSYTWPLWGAAYVIGGGCSDDSFDYFRGWLISRGESAFNAALTEPDNLDAVIKEADEDLDCQVEGWQGIGIEAWCRKTGQDYLDFPSDITTHPNRPSGDRWSEEDIDHLYPKLAKRF